jgi:hypothetical protein
MLKKLAFSVVALAPTVAMAGGGGGEDIGGAALLIKVVGQAIAKLTGMF